jgi:hypothetical protein
MLDGHIISLQQTGLGNKHVRLLTTAPPLGRASHPKLDQTNLQSESDLLQLELCSGLAAPDWPCRPVALACKVVALLQNARDGCSLLSPGVNPQRPAASHACKYSCDAFKLCCTVRMVHDDGWYATDSLNCSGSVAWMFE